jgi:hypothetical protein
VRVRLVLALAVLLTAAMFVIEMSGSAPRIAGSDHAGTRTFSAVVPGGGMLCQRAPRLPPDAARVELLLGTHQASVPGLQLRFIDARGAAVASGQLPAGARPGLVTIPLNRASGKAAATGVCLRVHGSTSLLLGGEVGEVNPYSERVDGTLRAGRIGLVYLRAGDETWWQLLPRLADRFARGKASFFGEWTLPVLALLLLGVWVATCRLLLRELT